MTTVDAHRPTGSYSARETWLNDPNGLIYVDGTWHMFYQASPAAPVPHDISWGHATSPDLLNWTEQPIAIAADSEEQIFSGSTVRDWRNTAGLGEGAILAFYTSAYRADHPTMPNIQAQSMAYSIDGGATWTKYANNPVINRDSREFRDPKVFWWSDPEAVAEDDGHWVMTAVEAVDQQVLVYTSKDLLNWEHASTFTLPQRHGVLWECPDLFPLPIEGEVGQRWVMIISVNPGGVAGGSATSYVVGDFDGATFVADPEDDQVPRAHWLDYGPDFYAMTSFSEVPDGRCIAVAWQSNWDYGTLVPTGPWRSALSLPRELTLVRNAAGHLRVRQRLVAAVETLRERGVVVEDVAIDLSPGAGKSEITVQSSDPAAGQAQLKLTIDPISRSLSIDRSASGQTDFHAEFIRPITLPLTAVGNQDSVRILIDGGVLTVMANDGLDQATTLFFAPARLDEVHLRRGAQE